MSQSNLVRAATLLSASVFALTLIMPLEAEAQRGRGGGGQRAAAARPAAAAQRAPLNRTASRPTATSINARGGHNAINSGNTNIHNTNINRNTNINVDVDNGWNNGWDDHWHPVATAAAVGVVAGTTAAITRAAVGSMIYTLPPACSPYVYSAVHYYSCGGVWYEPRYAGTSVTYVVVNPPL